MYPTFEQVASVSPKGLKNVLRAIDLPSAYVPTPPANGAAVAANPGSFGGIRVAVVGLTGDGSKTLFSATHNIGAPMIETKGFGVTAGSLGPQRDVAASPDPADVLNKLLVAFPVAPGAGVSYFVVVFA